MQSNRSKLRILGGGAFIVAVAGTVAAVNPAASAAVLGAIQSAVSCATPTACVSGANTKAGPGVTGTSKTGTAITASGVGGLAATGTTGVGVAGTSNSSYGVTGTSNADIGVKGVSNGYYGVSGSSNKSYGVVGSAGSSGKGGVFGSAAGVSAAGVYGTTTGSGDGVYGSVSGSGNAIHGTTSGGGAAVLAEATSSGTGVYATSITGSGMYAKSFGSDSALLAESGSGYGVEAYGYGNSNGGGAFEGHHVGVVGRAPGTKDAFPLEATDIFGNTLFSVSGLGVVTYVGTFQKIAKVSSGALVKSYMPVSSAPTVEDTGTAQLVAGAAAVRLDPTFAASIDKTTPYRVFLTPDGDTRGLYIAARTATGFVVRETQGGRSTLTFDYRIIAASLGQANQRMAVVDASELPRIPPTRTPGFQSLGKPLSRVPAPPQP